MYGAGLDEFFKYAAIIIFIVGLIICVRCIKIYQNKSKNQDQNPNRSRLDIDKAKNKKKQWLIGCLGSLGLLMCIFSALVLGFLFF